MNQSEASLAFKIPRATLQLHLGDKPKVTKIGAGRKTVLSSESEITIAATLKTMAKWGFGLTRQETLEAVAEYVTVKEIKTLSKTTYREKTGF